MNMYIFCTNEHVYVSVRIGKYDAHIHTYKRVYIHEYIYMYVCVCIHTGTYIYNV